MQDRAASSRPDWKLFAAVLLVGVVIMVLRAMQGAGTSPFFSDTDDAMRMVVVRDFLNGQPWYDLTNHRLNTPYGAEVHWSRLIDVPLACLLWLFTLLAGPAQALVLTGYVWPMLLLAVLLWVSASLAMSLVGREGVLPALILPLLSPAVTAEFNPGRVDHHNVVIILTLAMVWLAVETIRRPRLAIAGGLMAATALAVATEALPTIAAAILVAGLGWVFDPSRAAAMRNFGLAFAAGSALHLALYRPPARWLEAACDVLSPVYVALAIGVALAFTIASLLPAPRHAWQRFLLLGLLGGVATGAVAFVYPECLKGPYGAMDPWLQTNWLASINEAKPWIASVVDLPAYSLAVGVPVLIAVIVVLWRLWKVPEGRAEWAVLLIFLLAAATIMLLQVRGSRLAIMPSIPAAAWLIVAARRHYLSHQRLLPALGLLASWLAFAGIIISLSVAMVVTLVPSRAQDVAVARAGKQPCLLPGAFADLAALPPERILSPIDLGSHLLLYTPHEVVAAPYHRNQQGVRDTFRFFNDPINEVRGMLETRGVNLVVICPAMAEVRGLRSRADDSFASLYADNALPDWLEDVSLPDSPLKLFAVLPR
jgi:hypothetical protein